MLRLHVTKSSCQARKAHTEWAHCMWGMGYGVWPGARSTPAHAQLPTSSRESHTPHPIPIHSHACRSVPSGRVGNDSDSVFATNAQFRDAVADREAQDIAELEGKMGRQ